MKLIHDGSGDTQETDSAREAVRLRAQGYRLDGPAKNKARTTSSSKTAPAKGDDDKS